MPSDSHEQTAAVGGPLLRTVDLTRHFRIAGMFGKLALHAVDDFSFAINEREIVALVGESGSGKSTVARLIARVYPPTRGEIYFRERPIHTLRSRRDLAGYRSEVAMVFQDPLARSTPYTGCHTASCATSSCTGLS